MVDIAVNKKVSAAPLVTFRVLFGLLMFVSIIRFWANDWIEMQFIDPSFHFKYFGFQWVPDFSPLVVYALFAAMALSAIGIMLGAFYRLSAALFFGSFTIVELIDATYYLNHYYFVSVVALILIFLPANKMHSLDVKMGLTTANSKVPAWTINLIKFQLGLVYFMAGVAKLNIDWMFNAMPLALWLPAQSEFPLFGSLMTYKLTPFIMSWMGALYDLTIPFVLLQKRWRLAGYAVVVAFHLLTWSFFQIGMFPFIMIGSTLIFFSAEWHQKVHRLVGLKSQESLSHSAIRLKGFGLAVLTVFVAFQLVFPFRHLLYSGNLYWHEQGYRFGWRVMLVEKAGYAQFKVEDNNGNQIWVENRDFLTPVQEKMMSTQADFMIQYAQFLDIHYSSRGVDVGRVTADVFVTMNGQSSRRFIPNTVDLSSLEDSWASKDWIIDYNQKTL